MVATLRLNSVKKEYGFNDNKLLAVNDVSFDTHDAFSACYCERILFMQDGKIVHELLKNGMDNNEFLGCIVSVSTKIGEVESNVS